MLYYERIDISEGIDPAKSNNSKKCMICHYWFFNNGFKFQHSICNSCHGLKMLSVNIRNIASTTIICADCCCIYDNVSKSKTIHSLKYYMLDDRGYI